MATALPTRLSLLISLSVLTTCSGQCPISGCDGLRSFSSVAASSSDCGYGCVESSPSVSAATTGSPPRLLWSYEQYRPSGAGCVTDGAGDSAVVVCPIADGQNVSVVSFTANGSVLWYISLASQAVLPLVSYGGQSVLSDGKTLDWLARDGRSLAPPVQLFPVQGLLFDLTITLSTSIVTMLYRCGFIATYTVDGVPISGLWLNATVGHVEGTFIPLGNPVMNDTHLYILTAFRAGGPTGNGFKKSGADNNMLLRLYAINVAAALERKFTILWTHDVIIDGHIPYMYTGETYCDILSDTRHPKQRFSSPGRVKEQSGFPLSVLTMAAGRLLVAVRFVSITGTNRSFNMSVKDLGETYSVISSGYSTNLVTSISWSNTDKEYSDTPTSKKGQFQSVQIEGSKFWLTSSPPHENKTVLEVLTELAGMPVSGSSITLPCLLTTPATLLQATSGDSSKSFKPTLLVFGSSDSVSCDTAVPGHESSACSSDNNQPHLVGVWVEMEGGGVPSVVWSVPLPHSQPVLGQISTLPLSPNPLLFLTTPLGVYAYTLT